MIRRILDTWRRFWAALSWGWKGSAAVGTVTAPLALAGVVLLASSPIQGSILLAPPTTERVSVDSGGNESNGISLFPSVSGTGRYVAFQSRATNLVAADTNGVFDVFIHDRQTGATERVSVDSSGNEANAGSEASSVSADGRYVTFYSPASNLVSGDTGGHTDVFVHDRQTGVTERVSVDSAGNQGVDESVSSDISADGRYVAFYSWASLVPGDVSGWSDIFVHDRQTGVTERVSVDTGGGDTNGNSKFPSISADGRYVAFQSTASDLVPGDTNVGWDVFVHDRLASVTERVSVDSIGIEGNASSERPAISADGRYVTFHSAAFNLVASDTNNRRDTFMHDRQTGMTEMVSLTSAGSQGAEDSVHPSISADGRYVAFHSRSEDLVPNDINDTVDVFVRDRLAGVTERASLDSAGIAGDGASNRSAISADGRYVAFDSAASNLVESDTNNDADVFVRDRGSAAPTPTPTPTPTLTASPTPTPTATPTPTSTPTPTATPTPTPTPTPTATPTPTSSPPTLHGERGTALLTEPVKIDKEKAISGFVTFAEPQLDTNYTATFVSTDVLCRGQMVTDKTTAGFRAICGGNFRDVTIDWVVIR